MTHTPMGAEQRADQIVAAWLGRFNEALETRDAARLGALFRPDGHWRDIVGLTWGIATVSGREDVAGALLPAAAISAARRFAVDPDRCPPRAVERAGEEAIEAILRFETAVGEGAGLVEAARGALGHWFRVRGGVLESYQIIAPTSWNFSPRDAAGQPGALEAALVGTPVEAGEASPVAVQHVVRSFDPCMVCTVH